MKYGKTEEKSNPVIEVEGLQKWRHLAFQMLHLWMDF
jgi:hypothetical protein